MSHGRYHKTGARPFGSAGPIRGLPSPALLAPSLALSYIDSALTDAHEALIEGDNSAVREALDDIREMAAQLALDHAHRIAAGVRHGSHG